MSTVLKALGVSRSLEDPAVPITAETLADLSGNPSDAGFNLTEKKMLKYSPIWAGTRLIAGAMKRTPFYIYKRVDGGKERDPEHQAYYRICKEPNDEQTIGDFRSAVTTQAILRGNGYAYIYRKGNGDIDEIVMLDTKKVIPMRKDGKRVYVYRGPSGAEMRKLKSENVLHIMNFSLDGLSGLGIVDYGVHSVGMGMAAQKYTNKFYANGARPSILLEHPGTVDEEVSQRLRKQWNKMYSGLDNAHKTAVLENGMSASVLGLSAREAQLIDGLEFSIRDVANWFGLPPHKLGDNSRTAYNSLESENQSMLDDCFDFWWVDWEEEVWKKLLSEDEKQGDTHVVEFVRQAMVRADLKSRALYYKQATAGRPWMVPDDVRSLETMNALGGEAATFKDPTNNFGSEDSGPGTEAEPKEEEEEKNGRDMEVAARRALGDVVTRMRKRFRIHLDKTVKNTGASLTEARNQTWGEHGQLIIEALEPCAKVMAGIQGRAVDDIMDECKKRIRE